MFWLSVTIVPSRVWVKTGRLLFVRYFFSGFTNYSVCLCCSLCFFHAFLYLSYLFDLIIIL